MPSAVGSAATIIVMTDTPMAPEQGVVSDKNARELGWKAYGPSSQITEADVQREMGKG